MHLPQQIGRHRAFELLFSGKPIAAIEAARWGLINHAVPRGALMDTAMSLARTLGGPQVMAQAVPAWQDR